MKKWLFRTFICVFLAFMLFVFMTPALILISSKPHKDYLESLNARSDDNYCKQEDILERAKCLFRIDEILKLEIESEEELDFSYQKWNSGVSVKLGERALPEAKIKTRGNTTFQAGELYGAYNYKLKFNEAVNLFNFGSSKDWVLLPNFIDRSYFRQFYFSNLAQLIMGDYFSPQMKYAELYVNNEYRGLYLISESIEEDENRLDLNYEEDENDTFIVQLEQGRLWRIWKGADKDYFQINDKSKACSDYSELNGEKYISMMYTLEYPKSFLKAKNPEFIKSSISDLVDSAKNGAELTNLDLDSAVNFYLFDELFYNSGFGSSSVYLYRPANSKIILGPLWDFDQLTLENVGIGFNKPESCDNNLYRYLLKYTEFREKLYEKLKWFSEDLADFSRDIIDELAKNEVLREAVSRNEELYQTWGKPLNDLYVWQNPNISKLKTWEEHLNWIKEVLYTGREWDGEFYEGRVKWILDNFNEL